MRGHLVKRSKNSWSVVLFLGRDPQTGKKRQQWHTIQGNKKDAERKLGELLHQTETGELIKPAKVTVADFLRQWLADYVSSHVRPVTAKGYAQKINCYIIPAIGKFTLPALQTAHLQTFYSEALMNGRMDGRGGLSPRSVLHIHRILSQALSHAAKWGMVSRNVALVVDPPRPRYKDMQTMDTDGIERLLMESEGTPYHSLLHLMIYTGLRRSEILGLRWMDVDLDMATISVVQVLHRIKGQTIFNEPKSQKGRRQIALSPVAVLALREHREKQELDRIMTGKAIVSDDLVFSQPDGTPLLPDTVTHAFVKLTRRIGLKGIRLHDLRHTHATRLLKEGIHPKILQERLGHATISTTFDIYSHVTPDMQKEAAMKFEEGLIRDSRIRENFVGLAKD